METKRKVGRPIGSLKSVHPVSLNGKRTAVYVKWMNMVRRCHNPKAHNFKDYGGRGIKVCPRWREKGGYSNFVMDMGVPLPGYTLGRKDNTKGYAQENCRWETWAEQAVNRRKPDTQDPDSLKGRARAAGLPYMLVYLRVRAGWSEQKALTTPKLKRGGQPFEFRQNRKELTR